MKRSWARKWASYLEKPYVRQAQECLMSGKDTRCCLGHAEVVAGKKFYRSKNVFNGKASYVVRDEDRDIEKEDLLTDDTKHLFEMATNNGQFEGYVRVEGFTPDDERGYGSLAEMNDAGVPLKTIAKIIRKKYKEL
jgi:D-alanine-D-alanine ligase-like ATP-grasp enzyme